MTPRDNEFIAACKAADLPAAAAARDCARNPDTLKWGFRCVCKLGDVEVARRFFAEFNLGFTVALELGYGLIANAAGGMDINLDIVALMFEELEFDGRKLPKDHRLGWGGESCEAATCFLIAALNGRVAVAKWIAATFALSRDKDLDLLCDSLVMYVERAGTREVRDPEFVGWMVDEFDLRSVDGFAGKVLFASSVKNGSGVLTQSIVDAFGLTAADIGEACVDMVDRAGAGLIPCAGACLAPCDMLVKSASKLA
jgi:hypothetical protein